MVLELDLVRIENALPAAGKLADVLLGLPERRVRAATGLVARPALALYDLLVHKKHELLNFLSVARKEKYFQVRRIELCLLAPVN